MTQVFCSIITIGDELLIGQTIDTNSAWIAQQLNAIGIWVKHRVAVGDNKQDIINAISYAMQLSELVIITGGLGPTADDITKPLLSEFFGGKLVENEAVKNHVIAFFEKRKRPILDVNVAQAMVPDVCTVLWNQMGSAPGMWFQKNKNIVIALPGVPFEMMQIFNDEAIPKIKAHFSTPNIVHLTCVTAGKGESFIAVLLKKIEDKLPANIKLAYLPQLGGVKLRLTGTDCTKEQVQPYFDEICEIVNHVLVAKQDVTLEQVIGNLCTQKNITIGFAESCTGGGISAKITSVFGASQYCKGSIVSYTSSIKKSLLQVQESTIQTGTEVSESVAIEMANGAQKQLDCNVAFSITGYLETPPPNAELAGKIWICITNGKITKTLTAIMPYDRIRNTELAIQTALNNLRVFILDNY